MSTFQMDSEEMSALKNRLSQGAEAYDGVSVPTDQSVAVWGFMTARNGYVAFGSDFGERLKALSSWCRRVGNAVADTANHTEAMEDELQAMFNWDENHYQ
ncbi:hypothetical protein [Schaalia vaccimaxillae]|uniref:hypothetical protein n=1 Tax=Schaalia vaccimaxillae TaxID=183916 RepID=UPI00103E008E|nr:hypothetical protein [Schaalia vaccimaxillae]